MSELFRNSKDRLDRAYLHAQAFATEWHYLTQKHSPTPKIRKNELAGWDTVSAEFSPESLEAIRLATSNISLLLGEMAYQLRAALDGLIWDAVTNMKGSEPPSNAATRLEFPILNGKNRNFKECGLHKFPFPQKLKDWLESIQPDSAEKPIGDPDRGLKVTLEDIHNLARLDRHRRLRIVGMVPSDIVVDIETEPAGGSATAHEWLECDLFNGKKDFLKIKVQGPDGLAPYKVRLKTHITFEVSVEDILLYPGENIGTQLGRFTEAVRQTITTFERESV